MFHQKWADRVREASGGRIEITVYSAGSLAVGNAALDALRTSMCDIAWIYPSYFPGQFPLSSVVSMPLGITSVPQAANVLWDLYETEEALQNELAEFVPLMIHSNPINFISTVKGKPVSSVKDLKNLKLRAAGGTPSDYLLAWGSTPIQMSPGDIFQAVERGTIDGYVFDFSGIISFSLQDVTANYTDMPVYLGPYYLLMNKASFESLPEDLRQILRNASTRETSIEMGYIYEADERSGREVVIASGGNIVSVTDEAVAEFKSASTSMQEAWIKENSQSGFDAQAFLDKAGGLAQKYYISPEQLKETLSKMGL
ncbi:MAG: TRAP transporter substrate-binding protein [Synergistaceae bacterium]|nr:TRAP transporter substrate-binding protein [Synergistaceae bacterium]